MIAFVIDEDLGFVFETAESLGMDETVPVAREATARWHFGFRNKASAAFGWQACIGGVCHVDTLPLTFAAVVPRFTL